MHTFANLEAFLISQLDVILNTYLVLFAGKMVTLVTIGLPILIAYYGYSILAGRGSNATFGEMGWNIVRILMILSFMENTGGLLDASIGSIQELKSGFVGGESVFALLDQQVEMTKKLAENLYNLDANYIPLKGWLAGVMLWGGAIFTIVTATIVFISADVGLVLLTTTAPIFIGCLTYGFLKEMFNGWLRSIFSCIITLIFASMIVRIGIDINTQVIQSFSASLTRNTLMEAGAITFAIGIITSFLTLRAASLAGNIAGVAATSAIQGGIAAAAYAGTKLGASAAGKGLSSGGKVAKNLYKAGKNWANAKGEKAKLSQASQQAALERTKQENLGS